MKIGLLRGEIQGSCQERTDTTYPVMRGTSHIVATRRNFYRDGGDVIPKSVQLAAGHTAQEYNHRKRRKGAYWEDRYHATAVQTDRHLIQCIVYMDLNMVRAGVVKIDLGASG